MVLEQSARQWIDQFLRTYDLIPSEADPCVYHDTAMRIIVGIHIDDGITASIDPRQPDAIIQYLETIFKIVKGPMDYYVGFQVSQDSTTNAITLHQSRFLQTSYSVLICSTAIPCQHQLTLRRLSVI
jgi:hypothetical protein